MQTGMIGLGRMGTNMARRLMKRGHTCVVYDHSPEKVESLSLLGAVPSSSLEDMVAKLAPPKTVWLMLPAGEPTETTVTQLYSLLPRGATIIDGGNSFYKDDVRRYQMLQAKGINYVDA